MASIMCVQHILSHSTATMLMRIPTVIHKENSSQSDDGIGIGIASPENCTAHTTRLRFGIKAQQAQQPDHTARAHIGNWYQPASKNFSRLVGWLWTVLGTSVAGLSRFSILRNRVQLPTGVHRLTHISSFPRFPSNTLLYPVGRGLVELFCRHNSTEPHISKELSIRKSILRDRYIANPPRYPEWTRSYNGPVGGTPPWNVGVTSMGAHLDLSTRFVLV